MKASKKTRISSDAQRDLADAANYYAGVAPHMLDAFFDAFDKAIAQIERQPGIGSPRYGQELEVTGLRHWSLRKFPYAVFYTEETAHLNALRLVHLQSDIPTSLQSAP
jgi:toxin ParE1/3/4